MLQSEAIVDEGEVRLDEFFVDGAEVSERAPNEGPAFPSLAVGASLHTETRELAGRSGKGSG